MLQDDHHFSGTATHREVVLLGDHCDAIQQFTSHICNALAPWRIAYLDASHSDVEKMEVSSLTTSAGGAIWKMSSHQNHWNLPLLRSLHDLVFINGNHHSGTHQILICNPQKIDSVLRRKESIRNVILILLTDEGVVVPEAFRDLPSANQATILHINDTVGIANFLKNYFVMPPLALLILAGGKSSRMGSDKSLLHYHGKSQTDHLISIARHLGLEAFVSVRDMAQSHPNGATAIADVVTNLGPLGGICSAHMHSPHRSWLVVACDMPLIDVTLISELLAADSQRHDVLCYKSPDSSLPEPLLSLWKPAALRFAWHCLADGIRCPRKVITQCNSLLLECSHPDKLANANTPEDLSRLRQIISRN